VAYVFSRFSFIAIAAVILAHIAFAEDEHPFITRILVAVPAVVFILETRAYIKNTTGELPFNVFAMLQYWVAFGLPVFLKLTFYDLNGPVVFRDDTRVAVGFAVALGAASLWAGGRVGMRLGRDLVRVTTQALPPETVPSRWSEALFGYVALTLFTALLITFAPSVIPGSLGLAVSYTLQIEFALGMNIAAPPRTWGPRINQALMAFSLGIGLLRGQIEPMVRSAMAFTAGGWITLRRVPLAFIAAMVVIFLVVQPAKQSYRAQVWGYTGRTGEQVSFGGRVTAWQEAFGDVFSRGSRKSDDSTTSSLARLTELNPVMYAIEVVPQRVPYLYGESLFEILYSPIPRLIWKDKPTTLDRSAQRWAVIFGIQTERGSLSTAIGLNLLVEGFWNFGWFGIALFSFAAGLIPGISQTLLSGRHWALRAIGIAQLASVTISYAVVVTYSALFQTIVSRLIGVWGVYWVAQILSERRRGTNVSARRAARGRAI
jgi:hypothetical protein